MMKLLVACLGFVPLLAQAHITLNPNFGAAAGGYFKFHIKVPHGTKTKETTKLVIDIPHGVLSAKPEVAHGWDITIVKRPITPYISHGEEISEAPSQVIYTALCTGPGAPTTCDNDDHPGVDNDHLIEFAMQIKLGCDFGVDVSGKATADAGMWNGLHTLWFTMDQYVSSPGTNDGNMDEVKKLQWTGIVSGDQAWNAGKPKPSPYLFIYSSSRCRPTDSTGNGDEKLGMRWGADKTIVAPVSDQDPVKTKAEVIAIVEELQLTMKEDYDAQFTTLTDKSDSGTAETFALASLVLSAVLTVIIVVLFMMRAVMPSGFRYALLGNSDGRHEKEMDMAAA